VTHLPRDLGTEIVGIVTELYARQRLICRDINAETLSPCFERHPHDHPQWCDGCLVAVIAAWASTHDPAQ